MLHNSGTDPPSFWKYVTKIKSKSLLQNEQGPQHCHQNFMLPELIIENRNDLENLMIEGFNKNINSSNEIISGIPNETLEHAGKMFIYLNSCSETYLAWIDFYKRLFKSSNLKTIMQTLNRLIIKTKNEKHLNVVSNILSKKVFEYLNDKIEVKERFSIGKS